MSGPEVKAFFDIVRTFGTIMDTTGVDYYRASEDIKAFHLKAKDLEYKAAGWNRMLAPYNLSPGHKDVLNRAEILLKTEVERLKKFEESNCCIRFFKKATFPTWMIANLDLVSEEFDRMVQRIKGKQEIRDARRQEANNRLAPFSFSRDKTYVPIMQTVRDIEAHLAVEDPSGTMVLLHGESGRGKSTLAKYMALKFQEELENDPENCKFPGGIFFLACQKSTNTLLLMEKLWRDLGFGSSESSPMNDASTKSDYEQLQAQRLENLRRKLMTELSLRRSMLIIIDNVWTEDMVNDMRIPHKNVKYLVTSQKSHLCWGATAKLPLAKPSLEEARQILQRHSGTLTKDAPLEPQLEIQIDQLMKDVEFNPLVLANLGMIIKSKSLHSFSVLDAETVRNMREKLHTLLQHMDEDQVEVAAFWETYKQTIGASMTLVLDNLSEEAQTIVYLLVMCEHLTIKEVILKVWFYQIFGGFDNAEVNLKYDSALGQLKTQSIIVSESTNENSRGQMPCTTWSIHELRRQIVRERKKEDLARNWEKLMKRHSEQDDNLHLVAALCLLHGDATWCDKVKLKTKLHVYEEAIRSGYMWRLHMESIESFIVFLDPFAKDGWQKTAHESAKEVILHELKYGELPDEPISQLLQLPEVALATYSAIGSSYISFSKPSPKAVKILTSQISGHVQCHSDINSSTCVEKLSMYLQALKGFHGSSTLSIVPDLPETLLNLLQQTHGGMLSTRLLEALNSLVTYRWEDDSYTNKRRIVAIPDLLETLVRFLDKDKYPNQFEVSISIIGKLVYAIRDPNCTRFTAIPNALQTLTDLLPFSHIAAMILQSLAELPFIAEEIASTPAMLNSLLHLLEEGNDVNVRSKYKALDVLNKLLLTHASRKLICTHPEALTLCLDLISKDSLISHEPWQPSLLIPIATAIVSITKHREEIPDETFGHFYEAALRKFMALLANGVKPTIQLQAVIALNRIAYGQVIGKRIKQSSPEIGEKVLLRLMDAAAYATSYRFGDLTAAFHTIVIKRAELGDPNHMKLISEAIDRYARLLEVKNLQGEAAQALRKIALKLETCKLLDYSVEQKLIGLVTEGTKPSTVKFVTNTLQSILVRDNCMRTRDKSLLCSEALESYIALLEDGVKQDLKLESARALGIFASLPRNRDIIVAHPNALQKLCGLISIRNNVIPSAQIVHNVASAVESITLRGTHLDDGVGSFFSTALGMYDSLLVDEVDEEVQEAAIRALGKLAFNEAARKLFWAFPDAMQRLVGRLKQNFVSKRHILNDLAVTIDKFLLPRKAVGDTRSSAILSRVVDRYNELLGDGVHQAEQGLGGGLIMRALCTLCKKDDARRLILRLPGAADRIIGFLSIHVNADSQNKSEHSGDLYYQEVVAMVEVIKIVIVCTAGGTDLMDKVTVTLLLGVIESIIKLLAQVDGSLLYALSLLSAYPSIRSVISSHPEVQIQIEKVLKDDLTTSGVFVEAASAACILRFQQPDLDMRITAGFVSHALTSYNALQSDVHDVDIQPYKQVARRILDKLTLQPTVNHVSVSTMPVAWHLVGLLETYPKDISLRRITDCLNLIISSHVTGKYSDHELDDLSKPGLDELRSKAFHNYVVLLDKEILRKDGKSAVCRAIADHIDQTSDRTLLMLECPNIAAELLATFYLHEDTSIEADIKGNQSGHLIFGFHMLSDDMVEQLSSFDTIHYDEQIVFETMRAFTLMNPSGSDQMVLSSSEAFRGRAQAKVSMKMFESALSDYDRALERRPNSAPLMCERAYIRAQLSDPSGSLNDLHQVVNLYPDNWFYRNELGVLKQIMGNLHDALADFNLAVVLNSSSALFYILKQRGYVKYLLGKEEGARADAEKALLCRPVWDFVPTYLRNFTTSSVQYLEFAM